MALNKRSRDAPGGAFQKQQPPTKRHKPANKQIDPLDQTQEDEEPVEVDLEAQEASLKTYLHHAVKLLSKAIKTSKQFESQKLARKVKLAREPKEGLANEAEAADAEAQLNALKAISPDAFAPSLLSTRIGKIGYLRSHAAALQATLSTPSTSASAEPSGQSAEGKARNRLLTNKVLKEAWDEVSRALAKRMGQEVEPRAAKEKKASTLAKIVAAAASGATKAPTTAAGDVKDAPLAAGETEGEAGPVKRLSKRAQRALRAAENAKLPKPSIKMDPSRVAALALAREVEEDEEEVEEESEDDGPVSGSEYGDDDSDLEREMAALGGEGGEDWSGSEGGDSPQSDADDSDDEDAPPAKFKEERAAPAKAAKPVKAPKPGKAITSSAFLPSLAGGYISYSDSDGEDAKWVKESEKGEKKERKNRRGQRARQAIWEKKYGSGAKHIAKVNGTRPAPDKGTKAAKTKAGKAAIAEAEAKPELDARYQPFDPAKVSTRPGQAPNPNAVPVAERKVVRPPPKIMEGEKMHPSWEAKRRAAAQAEIGASAPKGKKITFD